MIRRLIRHITFLAPALLLTVLAGACSDQVPWTEEPTPTPDTDEVMFEFIFPEQTGSRAVPDKTAFAEGDVIHVSAVFTLRTDAAGNTAESTVYSCMTYSNGKWQSTATNDDEKLKWPWNSISGNFTAYYIPGSTGMLDKDAETVKLLSGNYATSDPLKAEAENNSVPYRHAVRMHFSHLTSRLIVLNTKTSYADTYWLRSTASQTMNNAYALKRNSDNTLTFDFRANPDSNEGCIASSKQEDGSVVFYLDPEHPYRSAELNYAYNRPYLVLAIDALNSLEPNRSYTIDIDQALGIIDKENAKDPWEDHEDDEPVHLDEFEVQEFIDHLEKGEPYSVIRDGDDVDLLLLMPDAAGHLRLMENVDFGGHDYEPKNLPNSMYLIGDYHYIEGTVHSLFKDVLGEVDNLGLRNVNITDYNPTSEGQKPDYNIGALAQNVSGIVNDMVLRDVTIKVKAPKEDNLTANVGSLAGEFTAGSINGVTMMGNITIQIDDQAKGETASTVSIGGVIGQSESSLKNVSMKSDKNGNAPTIVVRNTCTGYGMQSTGGLVGLQLNADNTGSVTAQTIDCDITCTVDASASRAIQNCAGGMVGRFRSGLMDSCNFSGEVLGGAANSLVNDKVQSPGRAYAGGITGYISVQQCQITNCNTFGDITGVSVPYFNSSLSGRNYEAYGCGGAIGCLGNTGVPVTNCLSWGKVTGASHDRVKLGKFIGVCANNREEKEGNNRTNDSDTMPYSGDDHWEMVFYQIQI